MLARQQVVVDHLAQQGVAEAVEAVLARGHDVAGHGLAQGRAQPRRVHAAGVRQQRLVQAAPGREHPQDLLRVLAQALDPHHQRVAQGRWHRPAPVQPGGQQLLGEERVALAAHPEPFHEGSVGRSAEDVRELLPQLFPGERQQLDAPRRRVALQLGEQRPQRVAAMQLVGPVGGHHQQALRGEAAGEERQERARGAIGPVDVLDREDQGLLATERVEQRQQRLEQPALSGVVALGALRRLGFGRGKPGDQRPELAPHGLGESGRYGVLLPCQWAESRYKRCVRELAFAELDAVSADHTRGRVTIARAQLKLNEKPGLAYARFTRYEDYGGPSGCRVGQSGFQLRELDPAAYYSCAHDPGRHDPSIALVPAVPIPRRGGWGSWRR